MGAAASSHHTEGTTPHLTRHELETLLNTTRYGEEEIYQLHAQFMTEVPSGAIPRSQYAVFALALGIRDPTLADLLFNAFDANGDGVITCMEFIRAMSIMTRGRPDEKIQFAFRMYDTERAGYLTREGVMYYATALARTQPFVSYPSADRPHGVDLTPTQAVDRMFSDVPSDRMTFAKFKEYCLSSNAVIAGLAL